MRTTECHWLSELDEILESLILTTFFLDGPKMRCRQKPGELFPARSHWMYLKDHGSETTFLDTWATQILVVPLPLPLKESPS